MANSTDHYEYMFVPSWTKYVAIFFSIVGSLLAAAFLYGIIWIEQYQTDTLKTVQVYMLTL